MHLGPFDSDEDALFLAHTDCGVDCHGNLVNIHFLSRHAVWNGGLSLDGTIF